jgi:hypothetical protein
MKVGWLCCSHTHLFNNRPSIAVPSRILLADNEHERWVSFDHPETEQPSLDPPSNEEERNFYQSKYEALTTSHPASMPSIFNTKLNLVTD